ncbi:MAG TPA: alpha/beta hydrolase [Chloroflexia bacterium]|nr:alpha/beta hydrolase [Chloroflexia bacterium]
MTTSMTDEMNKTAAGSYANVNGLNIYYEIHGTGGNPLVLLHGGFMNIDSLGPILPALAETRQVIAVELEGHGRTADLDRPLSYEQMAEDVANLVRQLGINQVDVFGFSMGGMVALRMAMQQPDLVRKLVAASAPYSQDGYYPSIVAQWPGVSPEGFAGTPMEQIYAQTAPNPEHWPVFIAKVKHTMMNFKGWSPEEIQSIKAPTLLIVGDADLIRPEHVLEIFHLLGGAREDGGMGELPSSQLAVLPGTTHFNILYRTDLLLPIITPFLDAPIPEGK